MLCRHPWSATPSLLPRPRPPPPCHLPLGTYLRVRIHDSTCPLINSLPRRRSGYHLGERTLAPGSSNTTTHTPTLPIRPSNLPARSADAAAAAWQAGQASLSTYPIHLPYYLHARARPRVQHEFSPARISHLAIDYLTFPWHTVLLYSTDHTTPRLTRATYSTYIVEPLGPIAVTGPPE